MYLSPKEVLATNVNLASSPVIVSGEAIKNKSSVNYTYSFWINVTSWNTNAQKQIITYTSSNGVVLFQIYLDPTDTGLYCTIANQSTTSPVQTVLITNNLPLQTWNHVAVSVQNMNVDCYLNGIMTNAMVLYAPQVQVASTDSGSVTLGNDDGMQGSLKEVALTPSETNPYAVWQYYVINSLIMGSSTDNTKSLKVSLLTNGQDKGSMTVF